MATFRICDFCGSKNVYTCIGKGLFERNEDGVIKTGLGLDLCYSCYKRINELKFENIKKGK